MREALALVTLTTTRSNFPTQGISALSVQFFVKNVQGEEQLTVPLVGIRIWRLKGTADAVVRMVSINTGTVVSSAILIVSLVQRGMIINALAVIQLKGGISQEVLVPSVILAVRLVQEVPKMIAYHVLKLPTS